ncbi:MAG: hypothetical protein WD048_04600 [Chitinophagales bacterium]
MKTSISSILLMAILTLSLGSCQKDKIDDKDKDKNENINYETLAEDAAISEKLSEDLFKVVDEESKNGKYSDEVGKTDLGVVQYKSVQDSCAIVTINTNGGNFPMTLTIDFGSGCTDYYGVERKGKVIAEFTDNYRNAGAKVNVSVEDYYVNDYKIEGTKTITNNGRNGNNNLTFSVEDNNVRFIKPGGGVITWESERTNEWTEGEGTTFWTHGWEDGVCDDIYLITGWGEGVTSDGQDYRLDVVDPLQKDVCCLWVNKGSIKYTVNNQELATLDYGDGTCDFNANLNYNGNSIVIIIK